MGGNRNAVPIVNSGGAINAAYLTLSRKSTCSGQLYMCVYCNDADTIPPPKYASQPDTSTRYVNNPTRSDRIDVGCVGEHLINVQMTRLVPLYTVVR